MNPGWRHKVAGRAMPLRLDIDGGHFAEVTVAPVSQARPFAWAAYHADGRAVRGNAPDTTIAQERAETALLELLEAA